MPEPYGRRPVPNSGALTGSPSFSRADVYRIDKNSPKRTQGQVNSLASGVNRTITNESQNSIQGSVQADGIASFTNVGTPTIGSLRGQQQPVEQGATKTTPPQSIFNRTSTGESGEVITDQNGVRTENVLQPGNRGIEVPDLAAAYQQQALRGQSAQQGDLPALYRKRLQSLTEGLEGFPDMDMSDPAIKSLMDLFNR